MYRPQVRFDFEVHDNATTLAQKKERKERLNKLVTLLDHQEDLLLRSNAEDGEEEGEDMKEVDRGGSRPGVTLTNTTYVLSCFSFFSPSFFYCSSFYLLL